MDVEAGEKGEEAVLAEAKHKKIKLGGWRTSPGHPNEDSCLELPGSGQPPGSSGSSGDAKVRGRGHPVFVRNKIVQTQDGKIQMDARADQYVSPGGGW